MLLIALVFIEFVDAFNVGFHQSLPRHLLQHPCRFQQPLFVTTKDNSNNKNSLKVDVTNEIMGGVRTFEKWWFSFNNKNDDTRVQHASFLTDRLLLRGLQYTGVSVLEEKQKMLQIPRSKVLSSYFSEDKKQEWDQNLAWMLLEECSKGVGSTIYGYCALITQGQLQLLSSTAEGGVPLHTAPDALRHWTPAQKQLLLTTSKGKHLVELEQKQRELWEQKYYDSDDSKKNKYTLPQFLWAMEVVHSRAFCGDFGGSTSGYNGYLTTMLSFALPLGATFVGYKSLIDSYTSNDGGASEAIAVVCAVIAALVPVYYSRKKNKVAVLLPFIDSANHSEAADSSIEYDTFQDCISLYAGPKCFVKGTSISSDNSAKAATQVFINYGKNKKDEELLLNYGFLNNDNGEVTSNSSDDLQVMMDDNSTTRDIIRRRLAETFLARHK